jgi:hypothetical protein
VCCGWCVLLLVVFFVACLVLKLFSFEFSHWNSRWLTYIRTYMIIRSLLIFLIILLLTTRQVIGAREKLTAIRNGSLLADKQLAHLRILHRKKKKKKLAFFGQHVNKRICPQYRGTVYTLFYKDFLS